MHSRWGENICGCGCTHWMHSCLLVTWWRMDFHFSCSISTLPSQVAEHHQRWLATDLIHGARSSQAFSCNLFYHPFRDMPDIIVMACVLVGLIHSTRNGSVPVSGNSSSESSLKPLKTILFHDIWWGDLSHLNKAKSDNLSIFTHHSIGAILSTVTWAATSPHG